MLSGILNQNGLTQNIAALVLALGMPFVLVGCGQATGPELAQVTGLVTFNGKPLPKATLRFQPISNDGTYSIGETDSNGKFVARFNRSQKGAMIGEHLVTIITGNPNAEDENGNPKPIPEVLPSVYHKNSTLVKTVAKSKNHFQFELEGQADSPKKRRGT